MKKLLAIALVLGISAAANAIVVSVDTTGATTYDVVMGESLTFTVTSGGEAYSGLFSLPPTGAGALEGVGNPAAYGGLGFLMSPVDLGESYWYFAAAGGPGSEPAANVPHFTFTYTAGDDSSAVMLDMLDENLTSIGSISIQNTPEPMTLGLLGLGGLFLRRRK